MIVKPLESKYAIQMFLILTTHAGTKSGMESLSLSATIVELSSGLGCIAASISVFFVYM